MKYIRFTLSLAIFLLLFSVSNAEQSLLCINNTLEAGKTYKINGSEVSVNKSSNNIKEKTKSKMTTFILTIIGGVFIFLLGQIALKLIIEPVQELKKTLGKVSNLLLLHQAKISNRAYNDEISHKISSISAEMLSQSRVVLGYNKVRIIFGLPSISNIANASRELNYISYGLREINKEADDNHQVSVLNINKSLREIGALLKIDTTYEATK